MFPPVNPEVERLRTQAILRALTEYREDSTMFAPMRSHGAAAKRAANPNRHTGRRIVRFFKAIKPNRGRVVDESVQGPAYSPR
jgi:hypothetical protein